MTSARGNVMQEILQRHKSRRKLAKVSQAKRRPPFMSRGVSPVLKRYEALGMKLEDLR